MMKQSIFLHTQVCGIHLLETLSRQTLTMSTKSANSVATSKYHESPELLLGLTALRKWPILFHEASTCTRARDLNH